jgi:hypothetical protein
MDAGWATQLRRFVFIEGPDRDKEFTQMRIFVATAAFAMGATLAMAADLSDAYKAGVAAAECGLNLPSDQSSALADVVQQAELSSGLSAAELDAMWKKVNAEAAQNKDAFCAAAKPIVDSLVAAN